MHECLMNVVMLRYLQDVTKRRVYVPSSQEERGGEAGRRKRIRVNKIYMFYLHYQDELFTSIEDTHSVTKNRIFASFIA